MMNAWRLWVDFSGVTLNDIIMLLWLEPQTMEMNYRVDWINNILYYYRLVVSSYFVIVAAAIQFDESAVYGWLVEI